jgi:phosphoglycolate phosphatase
MDMGRLAIFDLDGTLLDTIGDLAEACNHMLALRGLGPHTRDEYRQMVGNGILRLVERALPEHLRTTEYVAEARHDFLAYYIEHIDCYSRPYDGICEVLRSLQNDGWTLAVASNKFDAGTKRLVESFFSDIHFKAVYGNREGFPLKPDAALVELIIEECGASREMTYMIGDSGVDVEAAKNGGVRSVGCTWGFRAREELEERGADIIVDRPLDILRVLQ